MSLEFQILDSAGVFTIKGFGNGYGNIKNRIRFGIFCSGTGIVYCVSKCVALCGRTVIVR